MNNILACLGYSLVYVPITLCVGFVLRHSLDPVDMFDDCVVICLGIACCLSLGENLW